MPGFLFCLGAPSPHSPHRPPALTHRHHLQQRVLQLDVPVHHPLTVAVVQANDQLLEEPPRGGLLSRGGHGRGALVRLRPLPMWVCGLRGYIIVTI